MKIKKEGIYSVLLLMQALQIESGYYVYNVNVANDFTIETEWKLKRKRLSVVKK